MRKIVVSVFFLIPFATLIAACAAESASDSGEFDETEIVDEAELALTTCTGNCSCPLGSYCSKEPTAYSGTCTPWTFGPMPPKPPCFGSCQCSNRQTCVYYPGLTFGACQSPPTSCSSDCDCGVSFVCSGGTCTSTFGPFPACRCDKHCPYGKTCISGGCK
jgi:hypothetical protein